MAQGNQNRQRITVDLGSASLYRALKFAAVDQEMAAREIVVEALMEWLERHELPVSGRDNGDSHGQ